MRYLKIAEASGYSPSSDETHSCPRKNPAHMTSSIVNVKSRRNTLNFQSSFDVLSFRARSGTRRQGHLRPFRDLPLSRLVYRKPATSQPAHSAYRVSHYRYSHAVEWNGCMTLSHPLAALLLLTRENALAHSARKADIDGPQLLSLTDRQQLRPRAACMTCRHFLQLALHISCLLVRRVFRCLPRHTIRPQDFTILGKCECGPLPRVPAVP